MATTTFIQNKHSPFAHLLPCIVLTLIDERFILVSMVVLITMNGSNHIWSKQELTFVHNGLDTITIYIGPMKWVSIVLIIAMNNNSCIHSKKELSYCA